MDESKTYRLIPYMTPNALLSLDGTTVPKKRVEGRYGRVHVPIYVSLASLAGEGVEGPT
jgi:hypothetical protein